MKILFLVIFVLVISMPANSHQPDRVPADEVYTLYRGSPVDKDHRYKIATFDAVHGESYNRENCIIARNLFSGQLGVTVDYWCDNGYTSDVVDSDTALLLPDVSTTGMWAVQLGVFSNKDNAEKLAADLRKQGYAAFLSQLTTDSGELRHRVRIGPQKDRDGAEEMARRLSRAGHEGQVVPHP
jgi:hypothetical protein